MTDTYDNLISKINHLSAKTVVIGLGYVGLPLAVQHAQSGFSVTGIERNEERVRGVNSGKSYIGEVSDEELKTLSSAGMISATSEFHAVHEADVVSICVPTPIDSDKNPYTGYIEHVLDQASPFLHSGQLIVLESTTYPGTTQEMVEPVLTDLGLKIGEDVFLAYSPERLDPGNRYFKLKNIPRVIGGTTDRCTQVAYEFYARILSVEPVTTSSPRVAELTKLFENVFRVVNVSLVNELAQMCDAMNIDVWEVINAASTKPFGFMPFFPGPGVGGHCIPIDPHYLSWKSRQFGFVPRLIDLAGQINDEMPLYVVGRIKKVLVDAGRSVSTAKILMVGVAFKKDIGDTRESSAIKVAEMLISDGSTLTYHDAYVPEVTISGKQFQSVDLNPDFLNGLDIVVIATDHSDIDYDMIAESSHLIYDTRDAMKGHSGDHIHRLGVTKR